MPLLGELPLGELLLGDAGLVVLPLGELMLPELDDPVLGKALGVLEPVVVPAAPGVPIGPAAPAAPF